MKKILSFIICCVTIMGAMHTTVSAQEYGITPYYNNTSRTTTNFTIDDSGKATVYVSYTGYQGITSGATITTRIQKRFLFLFWNDIQEWTDEATGDSYATSHSVSVSSGTYRVQVEYEIRGTAGEADNINEELERTY